MSEEVGFLEARHWWRNDLTGDERHELLEEYTEVGGWTGPVEDRVKTLKRMYSENAGSADKEGEQ